MEAPSQLVLSGDVHSGKIPCPSIGDVAIHPGASGTPYIDGSIFGGGKWRALDLASFGFGSSSMIFNDANDRHVLTLSLTGSSIEAANLNLFFDITFAEAGFLWIDNGSGTFIDAESVIASGEYAQVVLDTNVNPPIPTPDKLLLVGNNAIRQTTLDGSITASIPEPASLTMLGLGLLGLAAAGRRQRKN